MSTGEMTMHQWTAIARVALSRVSALLLITWMGTSPAIAADTSSFTYDALGRLVQVARTSTTAPSTTSVYSYDPAGNRTNVTVTGAATSSPFTGQGAAASCASGGPCRYFMPPIAGFAPISY